MEHNKNKIEVVPYDLLNDVFPDEDNIDKNKLKMTTEGIYSVSGKIASKCLVNIIYNNMKKQRDIIITDGTANNGSDTLMLAKYFKKVNAIEYDDVNYNVLKNNIDTYGYKNVNIIKGDTNIELKNLKQDVIYIDPPWGGRDYKKHSSVKLKLGNIPVTDFYNKNRDKAKMFALKVPYNYDINDFILKTKPKSIKIYTYKKNDRIKFLIILIK